MARIVGYIATSLDGFIAGPGDDLDWLTPKYDELLGPDYQQHYAEFSARIRTAVMGRATYDWVAARGTPSPYPDKRTIVVTSQPLPGAPADIEVWSRGVDALVAHLRGLDDGDVWMVGGGRLQMAFLERGALDAIEIFVIPEIIGGGTPLFPPTGVRRSPRLISAETLAAGCVRLHYGFD
jgi:dihydrofolate reductase